MLAFIHVAKTGGRSIDTMLSGTFGSAYAHAPPWRRRDHAGLMGQTHVVAKYDLDDYRLLKRIWPFFRCVGGHSIALWSNLHELNPVRYFAFVRDPIKRGASHFQYQQQTAPIPKSWDEWLAWDVPYNHQLKMFSGNVDADEAIAAIEKHGVFIGQTEWYDESLVMLKKLMAPELNIAYSRTNVASDNSVAQEILADPDKRAQLENMYREEMKLYRYLVDVVYPRQVQAYGDQLEQDVLSFSADREAGLNHAKIQAADRLRKYWLGPWAKMMWRLNR